LPQSTDKNTPLGRVVIPNDETVPEPQHITIPWGDFTPLLTEYEPHTRLVSYAQESVCTVAYAISLPGARKLLYDLGMHKITDATDVMLRAACEGKEGRGVRLKCLTVLPQLFEHHRPRGSKAEWSEIREYAGFNERPFTLNVRWSTRVNLGKLVSGETDYLDLWPDGELPPLGLLGRNK
jgi:hypothetical protein